MNRARYSKEALTNLVEIAEYISRDDPKAAARWISRLHARFNQAVAVPGSGRVISELRRPDVREVLVGAYRLVYVVKKGEVVLLTVFEGHRLLRRSKVRQRVQQATAA